MNLLDKISSYDLLTSLIPGAILVEAFRAAGVPFIDSKSLAAWILLAYILGVLCNRAGSLFIDPIMKKMIKRKHSYNDYICASKKDKKLEALVEKSTFYRTMMTASILYIVGLGLFRALKDTFSDPVFSLPAAGLLAVGLFFLSYKKQEGYISQRVDKYRD